MKTTTERKDMYAIINNMILEKLQKGKMPWRQTWNDYGPARNYVSKKSYRGINSLILNNTDYEYPLFLTFLQVKELGGYIKKGSKSIEVIYWKTLQFENEDEIKRIPFLRYYNVFNIDCVEGIKLKLPTKYVNDPIECCENIEKSMTCHLNQSSSMEEINPITIGKKTKLKYLTGRISYFQTSTMQPYSTSFHIARVMNHDLIETPV